MKTIKLVLLSVLVSGSGFGQTNFKIESLKTFAKVYGYVKYFHPSDEAANVDWDNFAVYGSDKIEKCETKEQIIKTLDSLFLPCVWSNQFAPFKFKSKKALIRV